MRQQRLADFRNRRFGLFLHWGLYTLAARHEWVKNTERLTDEQYRAYFERFDPDLHDPGLWADEAGNAGMRYMVLTTKHHEGFALWDSALSDYTVAHTPLGKDLVGPLVDAFRARGLGVGFYHSLIDWHHPDFPVDGLHPRRDDRQFIEAAAGRDIARYREFLHGQVTELLTRYGGGQDGGGDGDGFTEAVRAQAAKRVALQFVAGRTTSWDHGKLGGTY